MRTKEENERIAKWLKENPEEAKEITRCNDCNMVFVEGEIGYLVSIFPAGFRDREDRKGDRLVCIRCYERKYGWNNLRTKVVIQ